MLANRVMMGASRGRYGDSGILPGRSELIAGNYEAGYYGTVPASELFTGEEVSSECGITEGTLQFNDVGWLKFALDGEIIFKSQKPYRYGISWNHIRSKDCVSGTKAISKDGVKYAVTLMKGLHENNPEHEFGESNHGSEWNRLMLPIHMKAKSQDWDFPSNVNTPTEDWEVDFTNEDLHLIGTHGSGTCQWCQDYHPLMGHYIVYRGDSSVCFSGSDNPTYRISDYGWSPVLRVIS